MVVTGECQDEGKLHQLRGLDVDHPEIDPTLSAHPDRTRYLHHSQQEEDTEVKGVGIAQPKPDVGQRHNQHQPERNGKPQGMPAGPRRQSAVRRRVQHDAADRRQKAQQRHQRPTDVADLVPDGRRRVSLQAKAHRRSSGAQPIAPLRRRPAPPVASPAARHADAQSPVRQSRYRAQSAPRPWSRRRHARR